MSKYIEDLIAQGEHQQLDFKFAVTDSKKIARSLAAFANTDGGTLLLGVKDNGRIAGVSTDEEYYMIELAADLYCKPPVPFNVVRWQVGGKVVLEVVVEKSSRKPHLAPNKDGKPTAYVRVADENFAADPILVKSWRSKDSRQVKQLSLNSHYEEAIALLSARSLTFIQLCKYTFLPEKEMEMILVDLLLLGIIEVDCSKTPVVFMLAKV